MNPQLPIDQHLGEILAALESENCLIVQAPPGTGKTTRAAPALLNLTHLGQASQKVLLIQPRRIAARAAAARIAAEFPAILGQLIGYQVRFDACTSKATRLIAMTPGVLLRQLQTNAILADVAAVVLDEFHERSLEYDLLLGMLRRLQTELRPELRLMLMSATLDSQLAQQYLDNPPVISVAASTYPVKIHHSRFASRVSHGRVQSPSRWIIDQATELVSMAARENSGDVLVFLPGVGEINQVQRGLQPVADKAGWLLQPLYGDMSPNDQDAVLARSESRKIILATNVAETSLTIESVRVVVDSGWARVQRMDPGTGLNKLALEPICQASAEQRAGRAGRTAPGTCYRMWDEVTGRSRATHLEPEISRVDLSGAVLQLLCWGEAEIANFPWLTPPRPATTEQALDALHLLGAVVAGQVTDLGRKINQLPIQPRLARLLIAGHDLGVPYAAALAAALLSERDIVDRHVSGSSAERFSQPSIECDVTQRVLALQAYFQSGRQQLSQGIIKAGAAQHVRRVAKQLLQLVVEQLGQRDERPLDGQLQQALLLAFPDRLARRRASGNPRGVMVGGTGVKLEARSEVRKSELFLCLEVDATGSEASVRAASAVDELWLPTEHLSQRLDRFFHPSSASIVTRRRECFLDLTLAETPVETPADEQTARQLAAVAAERFERLLPAKDKALQGWLARVRWLAKEIPDAGLPSFETAELADTIAGWCYGMRRLDDLKNLPWKSLLEGLLADSTRRLLETQAPESLRLPTGRVAPLLYEVGKPPILAARVQEFFGWKDTPRLAGGRVQLLLHLLAPNGRVQQITDDLASFWSHTYPQVRKDLRGRYPKHAWPENPLQD